METKICNRCQLEKNIDEFELRKDTGKYRNTCKECRKSYCKNWYKNNLEHVKNYREENKETIRKKARIYYEKNQEHLKKYSKEFREENKDYYLEYNKEYKKTHKEEISKYNKQYNIVKNDKILKRKRRYHKENKEKEREYRRKYQSVNIKERISRDKVFKIKMQLRRLIYRSFTRKGYNKQSHTYEIIGCDYKTFIDYLLKTFKNNYGYEWNGKEPVHIDHITPLATAETEEDVLKLCHYTNLQLLKAHDNILKKDKKDWKLDNHNK